MKEEQLEFIDVNQEDELNNLLHNNNAYADIAISGNEKGVGDSVVGNWVLKQSKVYILYTFCPRIKPSSYSPFFAF